jgi:Integrase core domain
MGAVGTSADNALAESFNAALKREVVQDNTCWADAGTCRREVFQWPARYNTKRRRSHYRHFSPSTTKGPTPPFGCPKPPNHKSRVHYMGSNVMTSWSSTRNAGKTCNGIQCEERGRARLFAENDGFTAAGCSPLTEDRVFHLIQVGGHFVYRGFLVATGDCVGDACVLGVGRFRT